MVDNSNQQVLIASFNSERAAQQAVTALQRAGASYVEIRQETLDAVLQQLETAKLAEETPGLAAALIGATVGIMGAVLSAGVAVASTAITGTVKAVTVPYAQRALQFSQEKLEQIQAALDDSGAVAVVVTDAQKLDPADTAQTLQSTEGVSNQ